MPYGSGLFALWLMTSAGLAPGQPQAAADRPNAEYYFLLGRYYEGTGKMDDAVAALKEAIGLAPANASGPCRRQGLFRTKRPKRSRLPKTP